LKARFHFHERTWHLYRAGDLEGLLAQSALLRKLRPNYANVFWNSAVEEVVAGRAAREGAKTDAAFASAADQSFSRARQFVERAVELGIEKPDTKGDYLKRQIAIREARLGEKAGSVAPPEPWDAAAEIERIISEPRPSEYDWATVHRKSSAVARRDGFDPNEVLALNRENRRILAARTADEARFQQPQFPDPNSYDGLNPQVRRDLALSDAAMRYNQAVQQEDKMEALSHMLVLQGGPPLPGFAASPVVPRSRSTYGGPR